MLQRYALPSMGAGLDWARWRKTLTHRLARYYNVAPFRLANQEPLVSFTFDDVPDTALINGAGMLEAEGLHGTFYLNAARLGAETADWRIIGPEGVKALALRGHEIGCHTFTHPRTDLIGADALQDELERNAASIGALLPGIALDNFAYPFGVAANETKRVLRGRFRSSRGIVPGVNRGVVDLQYLKAFPLIDSLTDRAAIDAVLDEAVREKGWVIFYTHDVVDRPSVHGCSTELFAHALGAVAARAMRTLTVNAALSAAGAPRSGAAQ